jgi:hypothetical protein
MNNFEDRTLVGSISKTDVLLALAEQSRPLSDTQKAAVEADPVEVRSAGFVPDAGSDPANGTLPPAS